MSTYRQALPQLNGGLFITDGGIETTLIFHDGLDLPYFAAFDLPDPQASVGIAGDEVPTIGSEVEHGAGAGDRRRAPLVPLASIPDLDVARPLADGKLGTAGAQGQAARLI